MSVPLLQMIDVTASADGKIILDKLNLEINPGETHVLMGHNGAGKSTLGAAVMGNPAFAIENGKILFEGEDITGESPDKRARRGVFMSFQAPEEVPGVTLESFLRVARGAMTGETPRLLVFRRELLAQMEELEMTPDYASRALNVGFSGGERKKSEVLQLLMLNPKLAILDETDSGLDVDAVRIVAEGVRKFRNENNALLIITHNTRLIADMKVDKVHVLAGGRIAKTGGIELIDYVTEKGFAAFQEGEQA